MVNGKGSMVRLVCCCIPCPLNMHAWGLAGGVLPVKIKAVPEGTVVPNKNVLFTMESE